jgi:hypothetical protein
LPLSDSTQRIRERSLDLELRPDQTCLGRSV